jgi:TatD DNase family protein
MLIDTHAHLDFSDFDGDRQQLFAAMRAAGIASALIPGVSPAHWPKQLEIAHQYACYYGLGIHPWFCSDDVDGDIGALEQWISTHLDDPYLVAIGECGLDKRHRDTWEKQLPYLQRQLAMATEIELPVILHVVKAHSELLAQLRRVKLRRTGVIHGFGAGPEIAGAYTELGFKLGIGGLLLNENADKLHKTVAALPLDCFVLETDSPSMTPPNMPDRRNTPLIIGRIIDKIADLQKKSAVLISERLSVNAAQLFDL